MDQASLNKFKMLSASHHNNNNSSMTTSYNVLNASSNKMKSTKNNHSPNKSMKSQKSGITLLQSQMNRAKRRMSIFYANHRGGSEAALKAE
jgi:hypothetical protein